MTQGRTITVSAQVTMPLNRLAAVLAPMVNRDARAPVTPGHDAKLFASIESVVSALDHLEKSTHTVGEPAARKALLMAVQGLRKAYIKNRNK